MSDSAQNFWDCLTTDEAEAVAGIIGELEEESWVEPLLRDIAENGGLAQANKARFFELRFGYALREAGITPQYEVGGEGASTLDFGFTSSGQRWLVELMRLEETAAVQRATESTVAPDGVLLSQQMLSTAGADQTQSEEGRNA